jgi:hypothetical protein
MQPHELFIFEHFDPGGAIVVGPDRIIDAGKRDIDPPIRTTLHVIE